MATQMCWQYQQAIMKFNINKNVNEIVKNIILQLNYACKLCTVRGFLADLMQS